MSYIPIIPNFLVLIKLCQWSHTALVVQGTHGWKVCSLIFGMQCNVDAEKLVKIGWSWKVSNRKLITCSLLYSVHLMCAPASRATILVL